MNHEEEIFIVKQWNIMGSSIWLSWYRLKYKHIKKKEIWVCWRKWRSRGQPSFCGIQDWLYSTSSSTNTTEDSSSSANEYNEDASSSANEYYDNSSSSSNGYYEDSSLSHSNEEENESTDFKLMKGNGAVVWDL